MPLTPTQVQWLGLIRYQADTASEQAKQPVPLAMPGVSGLHDAVEQLLALITEVHPSMQGPDKLQFMQLFDEVNRGLGGAVRAHRQQINSLNRVRIMFKHHGTGADALTVGRLRAAAIAFLAEACQVALDQDFDAISPSSLIADLDVRALVEDADDLWRSGDRGEAMRMLRCAFITVINSVDEMQSARGLRPHSTQPSTPAATAQRLRDRAELGGFGAASEDATHRWLRNLDDRVKLLSLGLDVRRYIILDAVAPQSNGAGGQPSQFTEETFGGCRLLVVETAIKLASAPT